MNDLDYVELYAKKLKEDNRLFKQQKNAHRITTAGEFFSMQEHVFRRF